MFIFLFQKMIKCLGILVLLNFLFNINGYKILVVSPLPAKSHAILGEAVVNHLANAGHEVSIILLAFHIFCQ